MAKEKVQTPSGEACKTVGGLGTQAGILRVARN